MKDELVEVNHFSNHRDLQILSLWISSEKLNFKKNIRQEVNAVIPKVIKNLFNAVYRLDC